MKIISGGQTGAERAALDWAIAHDVCYGGWCPAGRLAEDGPLDTVYKLKEMPTPSNSQRTRQNVIESDGTLVVNVGDLDGGTLATLNFANEFKKPLLLLQLDDGVTPEVGARFLTWLHATPKFAINVAGPRESSRPGIYALTTQVLDYILTEEPYGHEERLPCLTPYLENPSLDIPKRRK